MDEDAPPMRRSHLAVELAFQFRDLGDHINSGGGPAVALHRLVELARQYVPGADWAAVTRAGTAPRTLAASDETAREIARIQLETGQGPYLDAADEGGAIQTPDLKNEARWPDFVKRALLETPVRSVLTFPLSEEQPPTALNLYAGAANAFPDEAIDAASLFAAHAQLAVMHLNAAAKSANLAEALTTSRQIGMALGILMAVHKITAEHAFDLLRNTSQQLQRKLRDVAQEVTETGSLPQSTGEAASRREALRGGKTSK